MPGTNISAAEVAHVSINISGCVLAMKSFLVPFSEFPWFRQATIEQLTTIEWPSPDHLHWPLLDVDLSVESIRHPENFPLVSAVSANAALQPDAPLSFDVRPHQDVPSFTAMRLRSIVCCPHRHRKPSVPEALAVVLVRG